MLNGAVPEVEPIHQKDERQRDGGGLVGGLVRRRDQEHQGHHRNVANHPHDEGDVVRDREPLVDEPTRQPSQSGCYLGVRWCRGLLEARWMTKGQYLTQANYPSSSGGRTGTRSR